MTSSVLPLKPVAQADSNRFTVFFFRGALLHVRLLQLLVGGKWQSPSHVVYALNDCSYEITTAGLVVGERSIQVLYRECLDAHTFVLTDAQAFVLRKYFECVEDKVFDVRECIHYCFNLLTRGWRTVFAYCPALPLYGAVVQTQPYETLYFPPYTCTAPMWEALGEQPPAWNAFAPSALYNHLTNETETLED